MENSERTPMWLVLLAFVAILAIPVIAAFVKVESYRACLADNSELFCREAAR